MNQMGRAQLADHTRKRSSVNYHNVGETAEPTVWNESKFEINRSNCNKQREQNV